MKIKITSNKEVIEIDTQSNSLDEGVVLESTIPSPVEAPVKWSDLPEYPKKPDYVPSFKPSTSPKGIVIPSDAMKLDDLVKLEKEKK